MLSMVGWQEGGKEKGPDRCGRPAPRVSYCWMSGRGWVARSVTSYPILTRSPSRFSAAGRRPALMLDKFRSNQRRAYEELSNQTAAHRAGANEFHDAGVSGADTAAEQLHADTDLSCVVLVGDRWGRLDEHGLGRVPNEGKQGAEGTGRGRAGVKKPALARAVSTGAPDNCVTY